MDLHQNYLESTLKQLYYYKSLGEKTFVQLSETDIHWQYSEYANSIAIIVKHLCGNMLSRWTNFLEEDGEKTWRDRDGEFVNTIEDKQDLLQKWNAGWACFLGAVEALNPNDLERIIYIRNQGHTALEAINRQLAHYAYHIGQIVFIGTLLKGKDWVSLSIPRNQSQVFNQDKFSQGKKRGHFTDEFISKKRK
ncbi:MAG: DUF1572 family protein [Chitinophagales bacterium]